MEKSYSQFIRQIFTGVNKYHVDSLQDIEENKKSISLGRNGSLFLAEGNYGLDILMPMNKSDLVLEIGNKIFNSTLYTEALGILDQFMSELEIPVAISPRLFLSNKLKNDIGKIRILNPIFFYTGTREIPEELLNKFPEGSKAVIPDLHLIDFGNSTPIKKRKLEGRLWNLKFSENMG